MWTNYVDRAKLDDNAKLLDFTEKLEAACIGVVEAGKMTKDLALIIHGSKYVNCRWHWQVNLLLYFTWLIDSLFNSCK